MSSRPFIPVLILLALLVGLTTTTLFQPQPAYADPNGGPTLVINEIDYNQPGTDTAEFIEIKNVSSSSENLGVHDIVLVNGANDTIYQTIDLPAVLLAAGDYYVICARSATTPNCDLDVTPNTDLIQNGGADGDAVGLIRVVNNQVDAVSYEATVPGYVEVSPVTPGDNNTANVGISRFPDGTDTNNNDNDFSVRCSTPGTVNVSGSTGCSLAVELASFEASAQSGGVLLAWETVNESNNLGFNLYRTTDPAATPSQLNSELIASQAPGGGGASYTWLDSTVTNGATYYYWLESVDVAGATNRYGPVSATPTAPTALALQSLTTQSSQPIPFALVGLLGVGCILLLWARKR